MAEFNAIKLSKDTQHSADGEHAVDEEYVSITLHPDPHAKTLINLANLAYEDGGNSAEKRMKVIWAAKEIGYHTTEVYHIENFQAMLEKRNFTFVHEDGDGGYN